VDRAEKRDFVASLATVFADTSFVLVGRNAGLTVADVSELRRRMRAAGATYKVAKNRLALRALDGTRFTGLAPLLKGPTALAWSTDPVAVAKTAVEFARTNDRFVILGGALGTQALNADGVKALAELPSLETLRAQLLGLIQTPATRIAGVLQAPGSQLARVFSAFAKKDEAAAEAARADGVD
jgi:large subunit ribosomal protein L10